jgi:NAD(P)H-dependent FMN reductase
MVHGTRVDAADAFAFVHPEYNYGMTAPLKNALDFLNEEWRYKPVGLVSYGGVSAGTRASQMIKQVATTLEALPGGRGRLDPVVRLGDALRPLRSPTSG